MTDATHVDNAENLVKSLRMVSNMINMGERIQWGENTSLMDRAADMIEALLAQNAQQVEEAVKDKQRLDFLDECNRRLNDYYGTNYGWELILNHNVTRLMSGSLQRIDLNDAAGGNAKLASCRAAIDKQMKALIPNHQD